MVTLTWRWKRTGKVATEYFRTTAEAREHRRFIGRMGTDFKIITKRKRRIPKARMPFGF